MAQEVFSRPNLHERTAQCWLSITGRSGTSYYCAIMEGDEIDDQYKFLAKKYSMYMPM